MFNVTYYKRRFESVQKHKRLFFAAMMVLASCCSCYGVVLNGADVALYRDDGDGAWPDGVTAITNMLNTLGYTHELIQAADLNFSEQDFSDLYSMILFPGGFAYYYNIDISKAGKQRIRRFLAQGGGYMGICAGSFFACDITVWEDVAWDDAAPGYYNLDIYAGTGTGPINEIAEWEGDGYNMCSFLFSTENEILKGYKDVPFTEDILYFGGPYFTIDSNSNVDVEILATYAHAGVHAGKPAIIAFRYGDGKVVLFGPHPEIEEDSDRDGVTIDREDTMADNGSDWGLTSKVLEWLMLEEKCKINEITTEDDKVTLSWTTAPGTPHSVQVSDDLSGWVDRLSVCSNSYGVTQDVPISLDAAAGYFRVQTGRAKMVPIPAGDCVIGDTLSEGSLDERPVHTNTIDGFMMDRFEVCNKSMCEVMQWAFDNGHVDVYGSVVSNIIGDPQTLMVLPPQNITFATDTFSVVINREYHPAVSVTWYGAQAYCTYRSMMEELEPCVDLGDWSCTWSNSGYRLPTEAEWEDAARGGIAGQRHTWGNAIDTSTANYYLSGDPFPLAVIPTSPVGYYDDLQTPAGVDMANGYGQYDMTGNVWEWCWDWYDSSYYSNSPTDSPTGPATGSDRIFRGGCWYDLSSRLRSAVRYGTAPATRYGSIGLRVIAVSP